MSETTAFPNQQDDEAQELVRLFDQLRADRSMFETQWQEVAELVFTDESRSFRSEWINPGEKRNLRQYDNTATIALNRFVAILDALLTPNGQTWHTCETDDPIINRNQAVQIYFEQVTKILFRERYKASANFNQANQTVWKSLGAFGTGFNYIDQEWGKKGLRYKYIPLGNMYVTVNHQDEFDRFFRRYRYTAHQAFIEFGNALPENILTNAKNNPTMKYDFLQVVMPRDDYDPGRRDFRGMPIRSVDICLESKGKLREGGYRTDPFAGSRFETSIEETYGRSPAMEVLPTIKTLNQEKRALLKQSHRILDPILLVHDDGALSNFAAVPGAQVVGGVDSKGTPLIHALQTGDIQIGKENMDDDRADIKSMFMTDLFQILMEGPEMTATEVMENVKEKGILISPAVARQEYYLGKMITRELDLLSRQGLLPPMPKMLQQAGGLYKITFNSPLSKMRRAEEASGFMRVLEQALNIAQATQDPSVMYYFNLDKAMPALMDIGGVPASWKNGPQKVAMLKQAAAQQKATENLIQAGPSAAAVLKSTPKGAGGGGT